MTDFTPQWFVEKWERATLKEKSSAQSHFDDVCRMLGHPTPAEQDPSGTEFTYEFPVVTVGGGRGFVDVWYRGHFAVEYKGKGRYNDLSEAYQQLLRYHEGLMSPPLLVVCDVDRWEIHTKWPNTVHTEYKFTNREILFPENQRILRALFEDPERLNPNRTAEQVTIAAADLFHQIADAMRDQADPDTLARFLIRLMFCLFAEDADLLPTLPGTSKGVFSAMVEETLMEPDRFVPYLRDLFQAMAVGGDFFLRKIAYFDGAMFDHAQALPMSQAALEALAQACQLDWSDVEPAIFGTLFERVLDPAKRAQLGAHYTDPKDITRIVEPVLMQPLHREWAAIRAEAASLRERYDAAATDRDREDLGAQLLARRDRMLRRVREITVLDPACGSGNFLYVALQLLKDLERAVMLDPLWKGLGRWFDDFVMEVHPRQFYGLEIEPVAHALASAVIWIGYIQWNLRNGYFGFKAHRIMDPTQNIEQRDAILAFDDAGNPVEPAWPSVDVIVSNPPFLGSYKLRGELGDEYVDYIWEIYNNRVERGADLVCYWFERARAEIEAKLAKRAGLLATNSIRGGFNREVLNRVKQTGDIFMAWSDREWILEGAAVRVSMVGFDDGSQHERTLDGNGVSLINADLTAGIDLGAAKALDENKGICLRGDEKHGAFDIPEDVAKEMLKATNSSGRPNTDVIRPYLNGLDIVRRPRNMWIIDFFEMALEEAELYEMPIAHVRENVKPERDKNNRKRRREKWWQHGEIIPNMRKAIDSLERFIVTPMVAKHRVFTWLDGSTIPDHQLHVIARSDDYFFGVLHSRLHEVWSLRLGTWLGKGNDPRYTPTTTFETFPFPWPPGQEPADHPAYAAISAAAHQLHDEREAWLNPPSLLAGRGQGEGSKALQRRTLTNVYNALAVFRGQDSGRVEIAAGEFAPRLDELHRALDRAVCEAYGWDYDVLEDEEEMLPRLLALNLARAAS
jgi:hypothetical protein